jgi:hypothetical protein
MMFLSRVKYPLLMYHTPVLRYLHHLSAVLFYVLGSAFFVAYILHRNTLGGELPLRLLTESDLPLLACAMLYGATSVMLSIDETGTSKQLRWMVGLPMLLIFLLFIVLNFWNRLAS